MKNFVCVLCRRYCLFMCWFRRKKSRFLSRTIQTFTISKYQSSLRIHVARKREKTSTKNVNNQQFISNVSHESIQSSVDSSKHQQTSFAQLKDLPLLFSKKTFFIRCIKPNHEKAQNIFDQGFIEHQITSFNLLPLTAVRQAGFASRVTYEQFVRR